MSQILPFNLEKTKYVFLHYSKIVERGPTNCTEISYDIPKILEGSLRTFVYYKTINAVWHPHPRILLSILIAKRI